VRELEAEDLGFLNDLRVLALVRTPAGLELRAMSLEEARDVSWRRSLPALRSPVLDLDSRIGDWRITGDDPGGRATVVLWGRVGDDSVQERRWPAPPRAPAAAPLRVVACEQAALGLHVLVDRPPVPALLMAGLPLVQSRSELWALGPSAPRVLATTALEIGCARPPMSPFDAAFTCTAFDGKRTLLWSVDAQSGALAAVGSLPGHVFGLQPAGRRRFLGRTDEGDLLHIDPATRDVVQVQLPPGAERPVELVAVGGSLTALSATPHSAVVTVYQLAR
jgi:hypothetical protein